MQEGARPVVIDNGSAIVKAGFAGESVPRVLVPSVVATRRLAALRRGPQEKPLYAGKEALLRRPTLQLHYPIDRGLISNWCNMEKLWQHIFCSELNILPEQHPVLLTDNAVNSTSNREKMTEIMFETFHVPQMYISGQAELALHASGRSTGVVLESGGGSTYVVPVHNGRSFRPGVLYVDAAGAELDTFLFNRLSQDGHVFMKNYPTMGVIREIKETLCYTALDFESEMQSSVAPMKWKVNPYMLRKLTATLSTSGTFFQYLPRELRDLVYSLASSQLTEPGSEFYEQPDGKVVTLGTALFCCVECLFQPDFLGMESCSVTESIFSSICKCNTEIRTELYSNIILSGGNTMFPRLAERIQKDLIPLAPTGMKINVIAPAERKFSAWIGGSLLASSASFQQQWISRKEYEESGPSVVLRKCTYK